MNQVTAVGSCNALWKRRSDYFCNQNYDTVYLPMYLSPTVLLHHMETNGTIHTHCIHHVCIREVKLAPANRGHLWLLCSSVIMRMSSSREKIAEVKPLVSERYVSNSSTQDLILSTRFLRFTSWFLVQKLKVEHIFYPHQCIFMHASFGVKMSCHAPLGTGPTELLSYWAQNARHFYKTSHKSLYLTFRLQLDVWVVEPPS